ncbi:MAG: phosphoglycerate dehydrogenase [Gammaproteobacteria bacterium]|nr:phosphoglycerate dehydrogenase [Gammaproteobacteria bacterium]
MTTLSMPKERLRFVLMEGIHPVATEVLQQNGYSSITTVERALTGNELREAIADAHFIGIRSRTQLTEQVLTAAPRLVAVGCFCIGTNQVDLVAAERLGIPVFNAPFSNTRSVAELVLAEIVFLLRGIPQKNAAAHRGEWLKSASAAFEARGKTLAIIGYGHIGSQLGVLAEGLGMRVIYYDIENKLPLGNATPTPDLHSVLGQADVVSLHVPETPETQLMIGAKEIAAMRDGAHLINASRGTVVDIEALAEALQSGKLAGAAVDVFPTEPKSNADEFVNPLRRFDNVILTPHIGGSTQEAQRNIAEDVASKLVRYSDNGSTNGAVNFPQVSLPQHLDKRRILHMHHNVPGVLEQINHIFSEEGVNIAAQYLQTSANVGYVVMEVELDDAMPLVERLRGVPGTIRARLLH